MDEFEEIYRQYQPDVFRFLLRMTGYEQHTAEELTQETFYQAFLTFSKFRGECGLRTWLFQIAKNVYGKYIRRETRQRGIKMTEPSQQQSPPPAEEVEQREMLRLFRLLIESLDEPARSIVQYRLYSDTSYAEIARLLNIRSGTAAVIYNRTIVKLRKTMKERYGYEI
jgi:RNA polymerase sigma-70 factor (ECF subfamily)